MRRFRPYRARGARPVLLRTEKSGRNPRGESWPAVYVAIPARKYRASVEQQGKSAAAAGREIPSSVPLAIPRRASIEAAAIRRRLTMPRLLRPRRSAALIS